jgi:hypothetical protein
VTVREELALVRKIFLLTAAMAVVIALIAALPAGAQTRYHTRAEALLLSDASGSAASPDAELLRIYQPVLVRHPAELFQPTKIQSFVADSELERFTGTSASQLPLDRYWTVVDPHPGPGELPPSTPGVFYRLNQVGCSPGATLADESCYANAWASGSGGDAVYGRVVRIADRIVLQYWLFYYDDALLLPPTPFGIFWQSHEGDWEVVNVVLDQTGQPLEAAYSQHCTGERMPWARVEKSPADSTHAVVYVALGSHANYFSPGAGALGLIPIPASCIPAAVRSVLPSLPFLKVVDQVLGRSAGGQVVGPPGTSVEPATIHPIDGQAWSSFGGFWGESEYFSTPIPLGPLPAGAFPLAVAPASPANQAEWNPQVILSWPAAP